MNSEVFMSLLALDAYNRGPGAGLKNLPASGMIGNATILTDALTELDRSTVLNAGFYAIAYDWNGETVISYRGTNFPDLSNVTDEAALAAWNDIWGGWNFVLGFERPSQTALARA